MRGAAHSKASLRLVTPDGLTGSRPSLEFYIEPGCEEMWRTMDGMNQKAITARDLAEFTDTTKGRAETYLRGLEKAGIATKVGVTTDLQNVYQVKVNSPSPAVVDGSGKPSKDYAMRLAMWRTMKMNPIFTTAELASFASTDDLVISPSKARAYAHSLLVGGYLERHRDRRNGQEDSFKFKRIMNTGPVPPRLYTSDIVFDVNRQEIMTNCAVAREKRL